jgi:hypothetical protein
MKPKPQTQTNERPKQDRFAINMCAAECAARFEPVCANMGFFGTSTKCFRAGLVMGKLLKRVVSAEGIEPSTY